MFLILPYSFEKLIILIIIIYFYYSIYRARKQVKKEKISKKYRNLLIFFSFVDKSSKNVYTD